MNFTAIDVETSKGNRNSICQVGLAVVKNGKITKVINKLVQPPNNEYFYKNIEVHGITPDKTKEAPFFPEVWEEIKPFLQDTLVVAHNAIFDHDCLIKTLDYYNIQPLNLEFDCTYERTGHKLDEVCSAYGIELEDHHDAKCDAIACAEIYIKILNNISPDYSTVNFSKNNNKHAKKYSGHDRLTGDILKPNLENADPSSPFYNKKVVFTGVLNSIKRLEAAEIVKKLGADIDTSISKGTNFVITGKAPGPAKMKKIEKYNAEGCEIKIVLENDFLEMIH